MRELPASTPPALKSLLAGPNASLSDGLRDVHPEDVADWIASESIEKAIDLLRRLAPHDAAQVFERLDEETQQSLAEHIDVAALTQIAIEMAPDNRADFVSMIPSSLSSELLTRLETVDPEVREEVDELTRWPENSAGGLMTTDYLSLPERLLVRDAVEELRRSANDTESVDALFATDSEGLLSGVLSLRRMLLAESNETISSVMNRKIISVPPELDQEQVARKLAKYDLNVMPVVGERGRIRGVITADDILDVLTEEQSEDVHKMGAVDPLAGGYFKTSFSTFLQKRAPWLFILFFGGLVTTQILQAYEHALSVVTQLSFYLPLLISAGGNSGAQSSTLIIRGLAVGEITTADWTKILKREILQGVVLGGMLATIGVVRVLTTGGSIEFTALIGLTVISLVVLGCVAGAMTPLLLHRAGVDPATSSTPFIATVVDVLGIVFYLSLAQLLLHIPLG